MTKMRWGKRRLRGDRGLQMTNTRTSASSLTAYLSLDLSPHNFQPVCLPPLLIVCSVYLCLSVSCLQSNVLVTLNVISFLTALSLFSLRLQHGTNNHTVQSFARGFNFLIAWTACLIATVGLL